MLLNALMLFVKHLHESFRYFKKVSFNLHFKGPAELGLLVLGGNQVVGHDELLEVEVAITVSVQGAEHVVTKAH